MERLTGYSTASNVKLNIGSTSQFRMDNSSDASEKLDITYKKNTDRVTFNLDGPYYFNPENPRVAVENLFGPLDESKKYMPESMVGRHISTEEFARLVAEAGKKLDERHDTGKYTDEQYEILNTELESYTKELAERLAKSNAIHREFEERCKLRFGKGINIFKGMSRDEIRLERLRRIQDFYNENPPDYDSIFSMINEYRYGSVNYTPSVSKSAE